MSGVEIQTVTSKKDRKIFVELPWDIYRDFPLWVPPIKSQEMDLLTPGKHPFWDNAEGELFLAYRDGKPVGRIAAIEDRNANAHQKVRMCVWGFFECENNMETAQALFDRVEQWARERDLEFLRGPMNPSPNHVIGMLVEGFELPPVFMMPWNPPYYADIMAHCGLHKEMDLFSHTLDRDSKLPDWVISISRRLRDKGEFTVRNADLKNLKAEVALMNSIYNECWSKNWGFVPMSDGEISLMADELKFIVDSDMILFIYHGDLPVACCLTLPDINPLLKHFNGKLGLSALIKNFLYKKEVKGCRVLLFGVKEEYKRLGVPLIAFDYLYRIKDQRTEYDWIDMSWTLESNTDVNDLITDLGGEFHRRFRIFRKDI